MHIQNRRCRGTDRVHNHFLRVHADVLLHAEMPLVALAHLGGALLLAVIGRGGCGDDRRIHDRAGRDAQALAAQIQIHCVQYLAA